jgi:Xaa-Pro dipeptidase
MASSGIELAVISDPKNVYYFTGYVNNGATQVPTYLLVFEDQEPSLVTGVTEEPNVVRSYGGNVETYPNYDLNRRMVAHPNLAIHEIERIVARSSRKPRTVGIEFWTCAEGIHRALEGTLDRPEFVDISETVLGMRARKNPDEIEAIAKGFELIDLLFKTMQENAVAGRSELECYATAYHELIVRNGATSFQFLFGDFVSGERSLLRGGPPTTRVLRNGDTFIIDVWLTAQNYWADGSRTLFVGRKPSPDQRRVMTVLKTALAAGAENLKPGNKAAVVYRAIFEVIEKAGLAKYFPHHGGHGVGLDAWEPPFIIPGSKEELKEGMVCTLEPGVYLPEVGGLRIEDGFLITPNAAKCLCKFPFDN